MTREPGTSLHPLIACQIIGDQLNHVAPNGITFKIKPADPDNLRMEVHSLVRAGDLGFDRIIPMALLKRVMEDNGELGGIKGVEDVGRREFIMAIGEMIDHASSERRSNPYGT